MTTDTTAPSYWLNWRFLVCAIWILVAMVFAAFIIWKYEGRKKSRNKPSEKPKELAGILYQDEVWGTCSKSIHPVWLLIYRISAFLALMALFFADVITRGGGIFFFYTQWTFMLVTLYFGLAFSISIHGCLYHRDELETEIDYSYGAGSERGSYVAPTLGGENGHKPLSLTESSSQTSQPKCRNDASVWGYALQIIFSMSAGAVVLTDAVFWLVLYPFLSPSWYKLTFIIVCKHSVNAIFLLGDASLSRLRLPFFRIAYFSLFTCVFVLFQWILHVFASLRWPYPFLDLSSPYAPLWYLGVGLLQFPCFGVFSLIFRIKRRILSKSTS